MASRGADVEKAYWAKARPLYWSRENDADVEFALDHLLTAGRPRSALLTCCSRMKEMDGSRLAEILESVLVGQESDTELPDTWHMLEAVQRLETCTTIKTDRIIRLEFGLIPLLGYEGEQCAATLYTAIMSDPRLFAEMIVMVFKPSHGEREEPEPEGMRATTRIAGQVLHNCRRQPGSKPDGTVDHDLFTQFIDEARRLCNEADRLGVCDSTLANILATPARCQWDLAFRTSP